MRKEYCNIPAVHEEARERTPEILADHFPVKRYLNVKGHLRLLEYTCKIRLEAIASSRQSINNREINVTPQSSALTYRLSWSCHVKFTAYLLTIKGTGQFSGHLINMRSEILSSKMPFYWKMLRKDFRHAIPRFGRHHQVLREG